MPREPCDRKPLDGRQADADKARACPHPKTQPPAHRRVCQRADRAPCGRRLGAGSPGGSLPTTRQADENNAAMQESAPGEESAIGRSRPRQGVASAGMSSAVRGPLVERGLRLFEIADVITRDPGSLAGDRSQAGGGDKTMAPTGRRGHGAAAPDACRRVRAAGRAGTSVRGGRSRRRMPRVERRGVRPRVVGSAGGDSRGGRVDVAQDGREMSVAGTRSAGSARCATVSDWPPAPRRRRRGLRCRRGCLRRRASVWSPRRAGQIWVRAAFGQGVRRAAPGACADPMIAAGAGAAVRGRPPADSPCGGDGFAEGFPFRSRLSRQRTRTVTRPAGRARCAGSEVMLSGPISTVHRQDRTFQRAVVGGWWRRCQSADELAG